MVTYCCPLSASQLVGNNKEFDVRDIILSVSLIAGRAGDNREFDVSGIFSPVLLIVGLG